MLFDKRGVGVVISKPMGFGYCILYTQRRVFLRVRTVPARADLRCVAVWNYVGRVCGFDAAAEIRERLAERSGYSAAA